VPGSALQPDYMSAGISSGHLDPPGGGLGAVPRPEFSQVWPHSVCSLGFQGALVASLARHCQGDRSQLSSSDVSTGVGHCCVGGVGYGGNGPIGFVLPAHRCSHEGLAALMPSSVAPCDLPGYCHSFLGYSLARLSPSSSESFPGYYGIARYCHLGAIVAIAAIVAIVIIWIPNGIARALNERHGPIDPLSGSLLGSHGPSLGPWLP